MLTTLLRSCEEVEVQGGHRARETFAMVLAVSPKSGEQVHIHGQPESI